MKSYPTAFAFRRALEDRLNAASKAEGVDLQRMRRQVAFDRLLVRLFAEGSPPWRLKGGYALELKLSIARTTRDLDLGLSSGMPPGEKLLEALQTAAARDAGDFFEYAIGEPVMDLEGAPYGGSRHPVECGLDGRLFARFHLDIGMGDIQREPGEWTEPRDWLGFAGIPTGHFPSISREEHFAQKLHAYTMPRGDRPNTRVKDLIDLVLLIDSAGMDQERLKRDIMDTFQRRGTHPVPSLLEPSKGSVPTNKHKHFHIGGQSPLICPTPAASFPSSFSSASLRACGLPTPDDPLPVSPRSNSPKQPSFWF